MPRSNRPALGNRRDRSHPIETDSRNTAIRGSLIAVTCARYADTLLSGLLSHLRVYCKRTSLWNERGKKRVARAPCDYDERAAAAFSLGNAEYSRIRFFACCENHIVASFFESLFPNSHDFLSGLCYSHAPLMIDRIFRVRQRDLRWTVYAPFVIYYNLCDYYVRHSVFQCSPKIVQRDSGSS